MLYNFDEIIDRSNTSCVKYDLRKALFGTENIIPMWVADMDFRSPDFVMDAIRERSRHEILGYSIRPESYFTALKAWLYRRHKWAVETDWVLFAPGIVPAVNMAVLAHTRRRDAIIIQPPVYFPFFDAVKKHGRKLLLNGLILENGRYRMDFDNLEKLCASGARMLILSNPHNPGGNAWQPDELRQMAEICISHGVLIISDEIHGDLVNTGLRHTVLASLSPEIAAATITMTAPSKTFNLAGLATASVIISNESLRKKFNKVLDALHIGLGNIFGNIASEAAYTHGDAWLDQLLEYINNNITLLIETAQNRIPSIEVIRPEATYMAWINFGRLGLSDKKLQQFLIREAGLGLNPGTQFGPGGEGFMRMNLACPKSTLQKALDQLIVAIEKLPAIK